MWLDGQPQHRTDERAMQAVEEETVEEAGGGAGAPAVQD